MLPGCFSEASNDDGSCPAGTLSCPCDGGQCGTSLVCEPSIDRCVEAGCDPGLAGCTCASGTCTDGSDCTMGVCTTPGGTSGTGTASNSSTTMMSASAGPGSTPTDSDPVVTDSDPVVTDSDPVVSDSITDTSASFTETTATDEGPEDSGVAMCLAPGCDGCDGCGACVACEATPGVGACADNCSGDAQCELRAACALGLEDPALFSEMCCALPCDAKPCAAQWAFWVSCVEGACGCPGTYAC